MKYLALTSLLLIPSFVFAGPILRSGDTVSVEANQVLEGDFYGFGSAVKISGPAEGDVYVGGGSITLNAPVQQDVTAVGGVVQLHGTVGDDVRIIGGEVVIAESVAGDVVVLGGTVNILSTATIEGDLLFYGNKLTIGGSVNGSVTGKAEEVRINTTVSGDVRITAARTLTLGEQAEILGNLEYTSAADLARAQGAVVVGDIQKREPKAERELTAYSIVVPVLILLFAALTGFLLFKRHLEPIVKDTVVSYGMYGIIGLAAFFAIPFVSFILIASVLGMIVGFFLLFTYFLLLIGALVLAGIMIGSLVMRIFTKRVQVTIATVMLGTALLVILPFIPFAGPLALFAMVVISLGALLYLIYRGVLR